MTHHTQTLATAAAKYRVGTGTTYGGGSPSDVIVVGATPTPTATSTPTATPTPTATVPGSSFATITNFTSQWSDTTLQLSWATTAENKIKEFRLLKSVNGGAFSSLGTFATQSNCNYSTIPGLYTVSETGPAPGTRHSYKIEWLGTACAGGSNGSFAGTLEVEPPSATPTATPTSTTAPPCDLAPTLNAPAHKNKTDKVKVKLDWSDEPCAARYELEVRETSKKGPIVIEKSVPKSKRTVKKLTPGHKYVWRVRACNDAGCGKWSKRWNFRVMP